MPIAFHDEQGIRWTVTAQPGARSDEPGNVTLIFTSESGERRTCEGCLPDGGTWEDVDERAWRALLHHADVVAASAGR